MDLNEITANKAQITANTVMRFELTANADRIYSKNLSISLGCIRFQVSRSLYVRSKRVKSLKRASAVVMLFFADF